MPTFEDVLQAVCLEYSLLHPDVSPNALFEIAIEYKRLNDARRNWAKGGKGMQEIAATAFIEALYRHREAKEAEADIDTR